MDKVWIRRSLLESYYSTAVPSPKRNRKANKYNDFGAVIKDALSSAVQNFNSESERHPAKSQVGAAVERITAVSQSEAWRRSNLDACKVIDWILQTTGSADAINSMSVELLIDYLQRKENLHK